MEDTVRCFRHCWTVPATRLLWYMRTGKKDQRRGESFRWQGRAGQSEGSDKKLPNDEKVGKIHHLPRKEKKERVDLNKRGGKPLIFFLLIFPSPPPSLSGQLSANFSSCHFLPARSLFISELLRFRLFSPRTYLICTHPLPDQTCHTTTNYLIRAVPLHRSIPLPPLPRHNLRQQFFNSISPPRHLLR